MKSERNGFGRPPEEIFTLGAGLRQFTDMPFDLYNVPATFETLVVGIVRGLS